MDIHQPQDYIDRVISRIFDLEAKLQEALDKLSDAQLKNGELAFMVAGLQDHLAYYKDIIARNDQYDEGQMVGYQAATTLANVIIDELKAQNSILRTALEKIRNRDYDASKTNSGIIAQQALKEVKK